MKQLIPLLLFIISLSCRKINSNKQPPADAFKTEINAGIVDEELICIVPYEAEFPGGTDAWEQFLYGNLRYPQEAVDMNVQGTVMVQFVVGIDGTISEIEAISGPQILKQCAIDVVQRSPKWIPAKMRGRDVKSYKRQPVIFRLEEE